MSAIDIIDAEISFLRREGGAGVAIHALTKARDSIAELIEADKEFDAARIALVKIPETILGRDIADRYRAALARRAAALARVQGAQA